MSSTSPPGSQPDTLQGSGSRRRPGGWADLFHRDHRAIVSVLAGGVAVYAINIYLTTALLPSAVTDIGGQRLYAWAMTSFLVASVFTAMLVDRTLSRRGPRGSYLIGLTTFAAGSTIAAVAPAMSVLLLGRVVQGLGGGLLVGLGLAVVRLSLPERLWKRTIGLVSAMWGIGNVVGPLIGGAFAQLGQWRLAFAMLTLVGAGLAIVAYRTLPAHRRTGRTVPVPVASLILLGFGAAAVSVASVVHSGWTVAALLGAALLLVLGFLAAEARGAASGDHRASEGWANPTPPSVLPKFTYTRRSPLRWLYLVVMMLAIGSTVETFLPLFGQRLGGMSPLGGALLGAAISWGWSAAQILNSGISRPAVTHAVRIIGPAMLAAGLLGYGALQAVHPSTLVMAGWFVTLIVAGAGIGSSFAHWIPAAMYSTPDPQTAAKASAGVNTVELISNSFGTAMAGVLVSVGGPALVGSARLLAYGYGLVGVVAVLIAIRALKLERRGLERRQRARHRSDDVALESVG